jgi:signal recognition particle subunit SRP54
MVLGDLGDALTSAFAKLSRSSTVDEDTLKATLKDIAAALMRSDVNIKMVGRLRDNVTAKILPLLAEGEDGAPAVAVANRARLVEKSVVEELVRLLDPGREPYKLRKGRPNVIMFVGLQGAGKTTTVAKYAHHFQQRKWKVAMVCADTFRAGAFDQLKQNATRVRVPFYGSYTESDPVKIAAEGVAQFRAEGYEIIIVDTSGRHKQETALFEEMEQVAAAVRPDDVVFVMDSSIGQAAAAQAAAFKSSVAVGSVVITKLDGHAKGGGALSAVAATGSPIVFVGTGEHFEDLQPFDAHRFIGKLLGRGDIVGLATELKEKGILDASPDLVRRMGKGKFSLRDLRDQFGQVMKLGPLDKVLGMMPGMGALVQNLPPGGNANFFKKFLVLMDSMSAAELDGDVELDDARARRIIRGSGSHPETLQQLMTTYKQFEKMVGEYPKPRTRPACPPSRLPTPARPPARARTHPNPKPRPFLCSPSVIPIQEGWRSRACSSRASPRSWPRCSATLGPSWRSSRRAWTRACSRRWAAPATSWSS